MKGRDTQKKGESGKKNGYQGGREMGEGRVMWEKGKKGRVRGQKEE